MRDNIMSIRKASVQDFEAVKEITRGTIKTIYPHYYPAGAVAFFLEHHSDENISVDISEGRVYLLNDDTQTAVGTVMIKGNEICRLFVLPQYQGNGFGKELLNFAEAEIAKHYDKAVVDASLSAKAIYHKRGYKETGYHTIRTQNGDCLCYDVMEKTLRDTTRI